MTNRHCSTRLAACGLIAATWMIGTLAAQPPAGTKPQRPAPPQNQPAAEPNPRLDAILVAWEKESAKIRTLEGKHTRAEFNTVFQTEKRSSGKFFFEAPDKGRIDMESITPKSGDVSRKSDPTTKQPYKLETGTDQMWICTGAEVLMVDPKVKQYDVFPLPREMQGQNIAQSPLPFLFGMKAEVAKQRFDLTLVGEDKSRAWIDAIPLQKMDAENYQKARIILDKSAYVPVAVQLTDPSGTGITEYQFSELKINEDPNALKRRLGEIFKQRDRDPFRPDLIAQGYKRVQNPSGVQPASATQPDANIPGKATPRSAPAFDRTVQGSGNRRTQ